MAHFTLLLLLIIVLGNYGSMNSRDTIKYLQISENFRLWL